MWNGKTTLRKWVSWTKYRQISSNFEVPISKSPRSIFLQDGKTKMNESNWRKKFKSHSWKGLKLLKKHVLTTLERSLVDISETLAKNVVSNNYLFEDLDTIKKIMYFHTKNTTLYSKEKWSRPLRLEMSVWWTNRILKFGFPRWFREVTFLKNTWQLTPARFDFTVCKNKKFILIKCFFMKSTL